MSRSSLETLLKTLKKMNWELIPSARVSPVQSSPEVMSVHIEEVHRKQTQKYFLLYYIYIETFCKPLPFANEW